MKTCTKCSVEQPLSDFYNNRKAADGKASWCKACQTAANKRYAKANPEKMAANVRKHYSSLTPEEKAAHNRKKHENKDKAKLRAKVAKRRAAKLNATPAWADMEAIDFVYHAAKAIEEEYGTKWHVDHIVPLQGDSVCGLHVAGNLQLLSPTKNLSKSNKW